MDCRNDIEMSLVSFLEMSLLVVYQVPPDTDTRRPNRDDLYHFYMDSLFLITAYRIASTAESDGNENPSTSYKRSSGPSSANMKKPNVPEANNAQNDRLFTVP